MIRFLLWLRSISWSSVLTVSLVIAAIILNSTVIAISAIPVAILASRN